MKSKVYFGSAKIDFSVRFSDRKTLGITVTPDCEVLVHAPEDTTLATIQEKVIKKAPWILKQQKFFLSFSPKTIEKKFVSGETHLYLGRQYRLKILKVAQESVKLKGKFIIVSTNDRQHAKELLSAWYLHNADNKISAIAQPLIEKFRKYKIKQNSFVLKPMKLRWGSCSLNGKISLNSDLIKAPKGCIEYVIIHELCHLIYPNHSQKFIALLTKEMPDWEKWKDKLERLMA